MVSLRSVASNVGDGVREGAVLDENKPLTPSKDGCAKSCEAAETAGELESNIDGMLRISKRLAGGS